MRTKPLYLTLVTATGIVVSVIGAPTAAAVPECTNTGPTTTLCESNGSASLNTSPGVTGNDYPFGWPWWGGNSVGISIDLGDVIGG